MERGSVEAIVGALEEAGVRYLIAGGLAVVAHGYVRFTADFDLILDLEEDNARKGLSALKSLGYRPRAPVPIEEFADADKRRSWVEEKGMKVFSLYSDAHQATEVDVFVDLERLLGMKRSAGRPRDLDDIARLEELRGGAA